ncbi:MAG: MFS transporter [Candidatus Sericytochromatia bacterium]
MRSATLPLPRSHTLSRRQSWSAVGSMTMCVALLIASEFMPVSLLTSIATDLQATEGMVGQAISISGFFAVVTSLLIANVAGHFDRRYVLSALTAVMLVSLLLIGFAPSFPLLMAARALLGITVGGFWSLSTATLMQLVSAEDLPQAVGVMYLGNATATALAAPIGSYLGDLVGWRAVFWGLVPIVGLNLIWQWLSLPSLPPQAAIPAGRVLGLLKRSQVAFAMLSVMLTFAGAFAIFTYLRPFLESYTHVTAPQLSFVLLGLGLAGFAGTSGASALVTAHLYKLLLGLPIALAVTTLALLAVGHMLWGAALVLLVWGALNAAIPVVWFNWLAQGISDEPESGGGLQVAAIQLAILLGATLGGVLLDNVSIAAQMLGGVALLLLAAGVVGNGARLRPRP